VSSLSLLSSSFILEENKLFFKKISTHFIASRTEYTDIEAYLGGCNHFYMITSDELLPRSPAPLVL